MVFSAEKQRLFQSQLYSLWHGIVKTFITPANFVRADDKARDRKTLRGIQSVVVKVHPVEPEWQAESVGMRRLALMPEDVKSVVDLFLEAYASENPDAIKKQ